MFLDTPISCITFKYCFFHRYAVVCACCVYQTVFSLKKCQMLLDSSQSVWGTVVFIASEENKHIYVGFISD